MVNLALFFLTITFVILFVRTGYGQLPAINKIYSYSSRSVTNRTVTYKVYFIIKKDTRRIKGKVYNLFTFSSDSSALTGYIRCDSSHANHHSLNFLVSNFKHPFQYCDNAMHEQVLFPFYAATTEVCTIGVLGGRITITTTKKKESDSTTYNIDPALSPSTDEPYIKDLIFYKGFYPKVIIVRDVLAEKDILVKAEDLM